MLIARYDDVYGRFIIKLTWGYRTSYPSYVIASEAHWDSWYQTKESPMNDFVNLNAAVEAPKLTDEQLAKLLETKPVDGEVVGFVTTDDTDESEAPTLN